MSHSDFVIRSGSTAPPLTADLTDVVDGVEQAVNLNGATVTMRMRRLESGPLVITDAPVSIVGDPLAGRISYQWQLGDTDEHGMYLVQWRVVFSGGAVQYYPTQGYTNVEITPQLVDDIHVLPPLPDNCWPLDNSACAALHDYPDEVADRAEALAGQTLRLLTGGTVGGCPITIIPEVRCRTPHIHGVAFAPVNYGGMWYNTCPCGISSDRITLPAPIGRVDQVTVDSVVLDPSKYRVESARWLVRTDGEKWPVTPDEGFTVTYLHAWPVNGLGAVAAGLLACQYAKSLTGDKDCSLPRGVREINRQGISMVLTTDLFPNGLTGIREVDAYVQAYNPHGLRVQPSVHVPGRTPRVLP